MYEENQLPDLLYTEADLEKPVTPAVTSNYSVLKNMTSVVNGTPVDDRPISYVEHVDSTWQKIAPELQEVDEQVVVNAAKQGNVAVTQLGLLDMANRAEAYTTQQSKDQEQVREKTKDIARATWDRLMVDPGVVNNNSVEELANKREDLAEKITAASGLQRTVEDALKPSKTDVGLGLLHELSIAGPFQGAAIQNKLVANPLYGITEEDVSLMTTRSELALMLRNNYEQLPPEQRAPFIANLFKDLNSSIATNKLYLSQFLRYVIGEEDITIGGVSDTLDRLGVALVPVQAVGAGLAIAGKLTKASKALNAERLLSEAGGKGTVVNADAAKTFNTIARKEQLSAVGTAVGEITGASAIVDLTKLVSLGAAKMLPDAVTTAIGKSTDIIRDKVSVLRNDLQQTISIQGNADIQAELEAVKKTYSISSNPHIHNVDVGISADGLSVVGKVFYKPLNAPNYATKEAAEKAVEALYSGRNVSIVPDTTNTGFLVTEDVIKSLELERDAKLAQYAERLMTADVKDSWESRIDSLISEFGYEARVGNSSKATGSAGARVVQIADMDEASFMVKHGNSKADVKAHEFAHNWWNGGNGLPNPKSPSFKELFKEARRVSREFRPYVWANHTKHANKTEELLADAMAYWIKYPEKRASMPEMSKYLSDSGVANRLSSVGVSSASGAVATKSIINNEVAKALFTNQSGKLMKTGTLLHTTNTDPSIINFSARMAKPLGMEKHPIIVLEYKEALRMGRDNPEFKPIIDNWEASGPSKAGLHTSTPYGSIIVLTTTGKVNTASKQLHKLELFAHEYAHAFVYQHIKTHDDTFRSLHRAWVRGLGQKYKSLGKETHVVDALPMEAMFEYRNITNGDQTLLNDWVSAYFKGDKAGYLAHEAQLHDWMNSWEEFFAENFAKWSLTDEVPTTLLGKAFANIVKNVRAIAANLAETLSRMAGQPVLIGPNKKVAEFMNAHVQKVQDGVIEARELTGQLSKSSKSITSNLDDLANEVDALDEQISAHKAAVGGLRHGWLIQENIQSTITFDKSAVFTEADINSTVRSAFGKLDWNLGTSKEVYETRVVGTHQGSRYAKLLTDYVRKPLEALSKDERIILDSLLIKGDKEGRVFSDADLAGEGASIKTREAYKAVREVRDVMWAMRDNTLVRVYTRKGYKQLSINPTIIPEAAGSTYGRIIKAEQISGRFVYNLSEGKLNTVDDIASNSHVLELAQPLEVGTRKYNYITLNVKDVALKDITSMLPYRTGEYSRVYSDEYFIKLNGTHNIDGVDVSRLLTHRTAPNAKSAKAYATAFNEAVKLYKSDALTVEKATSIMQPFGWKGEDFLTELSTGKFGDNPLAEVKYNRTDDDFLDSVTSMGGLLGKQRGEHIKSVHGEENTLNPLDSIAGEISNTAYVASSSEWREANIHKWYYTFHNDFPKDIQAMTPEKAFANMLEKKAYFGDNPRLQVAFRVQDYITQQMSIMTQEEKMWTGLARQMSEAFESKVDTPAMHTVGTFMRQNANWPKFVRSIAFHSFQGMFNLKHLFMQGMNAFNAVTISPVHGLAASKTSLMYAIAMASDSEAIWRNVAKANKLSTLGLGMSEDEFVLAVQTIRRTGLLDGIGHNSMWGNEGGKFGLFNKATRLAGNVSSAPFNAGEGYSRLVSFDIARREFITNNPNAAWWTDDAVAQMITRQDDLTQNMTSANRNSWQQGWKSIPFQYTQYPIKLLLNLMYSIGGNPRTFSQREGIQLILGHTLLLGTAGWGLLPDEWTAEWFDGQDEGTKLSVLQGFIAGAIYHMSEGEAKLAIGSTFGSFNYYKDIFDGLVDPQKTSLEALGGPGGFAVLRWLGQTGEALKMFRYGGVTPESTKAALTELSKGFSSLSNAQKAYIASQNFNRLKTESGVDKYIMSDLETYAYSMGIKPVQEEDLKTLFKKSKEYEDDIKSVGKELSHYRMLAYTALRAGDKESYKMHLSTIQMILAAYEKDAYASSQLYKYTVESPQWTQQQRLLIEGMKKDFEGKDFVVENNPYKDTK